MKQSLCLTIAALCLFICGATIAWAQSPAANGWTTLSPGDSQSGFRYEEDGTVWLGTNKIISCPPSGAVGVSPPSPRKGFFVLICGRGDYNDVYVVQTQPTITSLKVISKNVQVEQKSFIDEDWVSWSPDEQFALFASGGEGFQGPMLLVNLNTKRFKEIEYKHLGLAGETEALDQQSVSWLNANSFHMRFNVVCQVFADSPRCASGPCKECDRGVHRTYWIRVNLNPFTVAYSTTEPNTLRTTSGTRRPATKSNPNNSIRRVDFLNFTYPTSICSKEFGFGSAVTVHNGDYQEGPDDDSVYFGIMGHKVVYVDLTQANDSAVVHIACGHTGWNWDFELLYLYRPDDNGGASRVGEINTEQILKDYQRYYPGGTLVGTTAVRSRAGALLVDWAADGPRCCPVHIATFLYQWNGRQFVLTGRPQRRPYGR